MPCLWLNAKLSRLELTNLLWRVCKPPILFCVRYIPSVFIESCIFSVSYFAFRKEYSRQELEGDFCCPNAPSFCHPLFLLFWRHGRLVLNRLFLGTVFINWCSQFLKNRLCMLSSCCWFTGCPWIQDKWTFHKVVGPMKNRGVALKAGAPKVQLAQNCHLCSYWNSTTKGSLFVQNYIWI